MALEPASPFSEAVASGKAWTGPLPADGPMRGLLDRIGPLGAADGRRPAACARNARRSPSSTGTRRTAATLPPIGPLVEFVEQAGRVLDEAFLARRTPAPAAC